MGPRRDRITPREDRVEVPGPDDLRPGGEEESVQSLPPADNDEGDEGIEGSPTPDPAEEEPLRPE